MYWGYFSSHFLFKRFGIVCCSILCIRHSPEKEKYYFWQFLQLKTETYCCTWEISLPMRVNSYLHLLSPVSPVSNSKYALFLSRTTVSKLVILSSTYNIKRKLFKKRHLQWKSKWIELRTFNYLKQSFWAWRQIKFIYFCHCHKHITFLEQHIPVKGNKLINDLLLKWIPSTFL